jgi:hypothetical protein
MHMGRSKAFPLVAIFLVVASLLVVYPVFAQQIHRPSVPEFSVQYIDYITNIAPTTSTSINPYTGQNMTTTSQGGTSHNETIVFTIKNQPFTPYKDSNGNYIGIYFNFRYKGHFEANWTYLPFNPDGETSTPWGGWLDRSLPYFSHFSQSASNYTTFVFPLTNFLPYGNSAFSNGGQIDFQVQAQIGNISYSSEGTQSLGDYYRFTGQSSDWSSTQTLNINFNSNSTNLTPTPTPMTYLPPRNAPQLDPVYYLIPVSVTAAIVILSILVFRRHRKTSSLKQ